MPVWLPYSTATLGPVGTVLDDVVGLPCTAPATEGSSAVSGPDVMRLYHQYLKEHDGRDGEVELGGTQKHDDRNEHDGGRQLHHGDLRITAAAT